MGTLSKGFVKFLWGYSQGKPDRWTLFIRREIQKQENSVRRDQRYTGFIDVRRFRIHARIPEISDFGVMPMLSQYHVSLSACRSGEKCTEWTVVQDAGLLEGVANITLMQSNRGCICDLFDSRDKYATLLPKGTNTMIGNGLTKGISNMYFSQHITFDYKNTPQPFKVKD
ncbi:uncharacterized protein LAJ45_03185 [Morchella importuna]|uniref:uncharacterized protein n=1 Tax=Morchella importuna TaxID=1174673 RepID=UPI001E8D7252|nr:uncharacterized protein LAJ45_03185 [Morchella importuna]KAH8152958.1 hypothetical protein LAJ45_03185 [Morchella importuna]